MSAIDRLIEERIRAAVERGELSGLPGEAGRPARDLTLVPGRCRWLSGCSRMPECRPRDRRAGSNCTSSPKCAAR